MNTRKAFALGVVAGNYVLALRSSGFPFFAAAIAGIWVLAYGYYLARWSEARA